MPISISILYDNLSFEAGLESAWGFSCLIQGLEKTILFDTGGNGRILVSNMKNLGINPADIDLVLLSHEHNDHTGGLELFLTENPRATVLLPESFSLQIKQMIKTQNGDYLKISQAEEICKDAYTTGELGDSIKEQGLVIKTQKGLLVITGCAHPGIIYMLDRIRQNFRESFYLVLGGFHLFNLSEEEVEKIIGQFKEKRVFKSAPAHCSGDKARGLFEKGYGSDFVKLSVGTRVIVE